MNSAEKRSIRTQVITDPSVQGELLFRTLVYWSLCLTIVLLTTLGWSLWSGPSQTLMSAVRETLVAAAPAIAGSVILLPLVMMDMLRVSNRFVGPVRQVRYVLRHLVSEAKPENGRRVYLRKGDFWQDLAQLTNLLADEIEQGRESAAMDQGVHHNPPNPFSPLDEADELDGQQAPADADLLQPTTP